MRFDYASRTLRTASLELDYFLVPWDTDILAFPVGQIGKINLLAAQAAETDFSAFERWRDEESIRLISCRLPHRGLRESMFLESRGFRFVEMVFQPELTTLQEIHFPDTGIEITAATEHDLTELEDIAASCFGDGRFHVDPRLGPAIGDRRYRIWVRNSFRHPAQHLLRITEAGRTVGVYVVEAQVDGTAYWHLTGIAPACQGQGIGKRVWQAMLMRHKAEGATAVRTTISARNTRVMNLYAGLGFRFQPPLMTFHWVRD
jgi:ribosomal protein S18 acetylase RimI-like enzyme